MTDSPDDTNTLKLVIVLDKASLHLDEAEQQLRELKESLSPTLLSLDIYYAHPSTLMTLLHFSEKPAMETVVNALKSSTTCKWRSLNLTVLSATERERFLSLYPHRFAWHQKDVCDFPAAFAQMKQVAINARSKQRPVSTSNVAIPVRFHTGAELGNGAIRDVSTNTVYIESRFEVIPNNDLILIVPTNQNQTMNIQVHVGYSLSEAEAKKRGRLAGFSAELRLGPQEQTLFESFVVAAARGLQWPERSGRKFDRFPFEMRAEYDFENTRRREKTLNLSRGGLFLETFDPPPKGTHLVLSLFASGKIGSVDFPGQVVHVTPPEACFGADNKRPGAGVTFTESADLVEKKMTELLARVDVPTSRRALVVDDDRFFRTVVGNTLRVAGFEVQEAAEGGEAFLLLLDEFLCFDIAIVDLYMPGMPGLELVNKIRRVGGEVELAIMVMTGADLNETERQRVLAAGVDEIVTKGTPPEIILEKVENCLLAKIPKEKRE